MSKDKVIALIATILLLLTTTVAFATERTDYVGNVPDNQELQSKEDIAIQKYNQLLSLWSNHIDKDGNLIIDYPDYYGGAYIDNAKNLVILIKNNSKLDNENFEILDSDNVRFENVKYSLKELLDIKSDIKLSKDITGIGISLKDNCIKIYTPSSDTKQSLCKKIISTNNMHLPSDCVIIEHSEGIDSPVSAVQPGSKITSGNRTRSVGFWAKDVNGALGIVTAPHDTLTKGTPIKINGVEFGKAGMPIFSGNTDAMFVKRSNNSFTATREIPGFRFSLKNSALSLPVGSTIYARGISSGYMTGKIEDIHYTTSYGISDTVVASATCDEGDSGGIVAGGGNISERYVAGIITGKKGDSNKLIYCKAINLLNRLNITIY